MLRSLALAAFAVLALAPAGGSGTDLAIGPHLTIQGQPGAQRPRIVQEDPYTSCNCPILSSNGHVTFRHLSLDQSVDNAAAGGLNLNGDDVVEDVLSIGGHRGGSVTAANNEIRDSVFVGGASGLATAASVHLEQLDRAGRYERPRRRRRHRRSRCSDRHHRALLGDRPERG